MVDIHSHVLPGVDDGAQTIEESLEMLKIAAAAGTTDIVATPHANSQFPFHAERIEEAFRDLSERSRHLINLHLGCDFHINFENLGDTLRNPEKYTINHGRYLMVELPDLVALPAIQQALRQLVRMRISPVITHPERNVSLQAKLHELERWIADGCFVQVTGQSLLGRFGQSARRAADSLLKAGLVHFIASDAHDCTDRPPDLSHAYKYISAHYGTSLAEALCIYNPAAALYNETVTSMWRRPGKLRSLFSFWK